MYTALFTRTTHAHSPSHMCGGDLSRLWTIMIIARPLCGGFHWSLSIWWLPITSIFCCCCWFISFLYIVWFGFLLDIEWHCRQRQTCGARRQFGDMTARRRRLCRISANRCTHTHVYRRHAIARYGIVCEIGYTHSHSRCGNWLKHFVWI